MTPKQKLIEAVKKEIKISITHSRKTIGYEKDMAINSIEQSKHFLKLIEEILPNE